MHLLGRCQRGGGVVVVALVAAGCSLVAARFRAEPTFFPLTPLSHWEYAVQRRDGRESFRFIATVKPDEFQAQDGRRCRVVDERYTDVGGDERFPIVYCNEGGYLHRV